MGMNTSTGLPYYEAVTVSYLRPKRLPTSVLAPLSIPLLVFVFATAPYAALTMFQVEP
jgi:hypothetical protein